MLYRFFRFLLFLIFNLIFRLEVEEKGYVPRKGGFILASNHLSILDPMVLGVACPRVLNFMAKEELFSNPPFAWLISSVGSFPVKRNSTDISALREAIKRLKDGKALLLFPEGRRSDAEVMPEKAEQGISFLAKKVNVPVVPAFIKGTERALPRGAKFIRPAKLSVRFGEQFYIERGLPYQDAAQLIMAKIRNLSCEVA
jgi:1-acyl-sn-glycerol-3-phosphate acyltransferase